MDTNYTNFDKHFETEYKRKDVVWYRQKDLFLQYKQTRVINHVFESQQRSVTINGFHVYNFVIRMLPNRVCSVY